MKLSELYGHLAQARDWADRIGTDPEVKVDRTRSIERVAFELTPDGAILIDLTEEDE